MADQIGELGSRTEDAQLCSRSYQVEMFQASLEGNTIVVMGTGTGKTHVAFLRIMHELEKNKTAKMIWFLAPSVTLCQQQRATLAKYLPAFSIQLITGDDNVPHWSNQQTWDAILGGHQVIVCTHAILWEALSSGFVQMHAIGLIIFDEAHHCFGQHDANKIMRNYYQRNRREGREVPSILGLTASPVTKIKAIEPSLREVERNLDSTVKTPNIHRVDLKRFANAPSFKEIIYDPTTVGSCPSFRSLQKVIQSLDIYQDPEVKTLLQKPDRQDELKGVLESRKTKSQTALKQFLGKADHVLQELGAFAAEYFVVIAISRLKTAIANQNELLFGWQDSVSTYILQVLQQVEVTPLDEWSDSDVLRGDRISLKVARLIEFLRSLPEKSFHGIIFVEQRVVAALLSEILSVHPLTKDIGSGSFVGASNNVQRRTTLGDLANLAVQQEVLHKFRSRETRLIVATNALDEGIDVPSCNLVICFAKPQTLKAYIQKKGRARDQKSSFVIMIAQNDDKGRKNWSALEEEMTRAYQAEKNEADRQLATEELEEIDGREFRINSTGALLTMDMSMARLHHFCASLPRDQFVDTRPIFTFDLLETKNERRATVLLPNSLDSSLRLFQGTLYWKTEKQAKKDAAFVAYKSLYHAGLVNDNLMPIVELKRLPEFEIEKRKSKVMVGPTIDPWKTMNQAWMAPTYTLHAFPIIVKQSEQPFLTMHAIFPVPPPMFTGITLHWDNENVVHVEFGSAASLLVPSQLEFVSLARKANKIILETIFSSKMLRDQEDFSCLFIPTLDETELRQWIQENTGEIAARDLVHQDTPVHILCRNAEFRGSSFLFRSWMREEEKLSVIAVQRRRNFLQPPSVRKIRDKDVKTQELPLDGTVFSRTGLLYVTFALLVPSIMHHMTGEIIATDLKLRLAGVDDVRTSQIITAITASSASASQNYQVYEIIGDSVLKFLISRYLFFKMTKWHEGYLSLVKGGIVSNARLCRAALEMGLDRYIITDPFSPRKWRPSYIEQTEDPTDERLMSTKILADVVESLLGAAFVNVGLSAASKCAATFFSEEMPDLEDSENVRDNHSQEDIECAEHFDRIQTLLNYRFKKPSLLISALTHPSFASDLVTPSYQRLEFLGDAILDLIVIQRLSAPDMAKLGHIDIHLTKSAVVNGDYLAYLCLGQSFGSTSGVLIQNIVKSAKSAQVNITTSTVTRNVLLPEVLRVSLHNEEIHAARSGCIARYKKLDSELNKALTEGDSHPYVLLSQLGAPKFMSDIMESILGAVYIDSQGDLSMCKQLCTRWGILSYLERIVTHKINVVHPKTRLGMLAARYTIELAALEKDDEMQPDSIKGEDAVPKGKGRPQARVGYTFGREKASNVAGESSNKQFELLQSRPQELSCTYTCFASMKGIDFPKIEGAMWKSEAIARASVAACEVLEQKLKDMTGTNPRNIRKDPDED